MNKVVIKCCDTCSRTFYCRYPEEETCESWAPDIYAIAEIANGAEAITREEYYERIIDEAEQETRDAG